MNSSLIIKNIIEFSNNTKTNQTSKINITNTTNDDFIYKFLVINNKLCSITQPKGIIEKNTTKEIQITVLPEAINTINKIVIYTLNTKYITINNTNDIWTIYKHLIERYTIDVHYVNTNNTMYNNIFIYIYIITFILILLFLININYFF